MMKRAISLLVLIAALLIAPSSVPSGRWVDARALGVTTASAQIGPMFNPMVMKAAGACPNSSKLSTIISNAGLMTDLKLVLDAGDIASWPGSGTKWLDVSGAGDDFFRGATGSGSDTPSFNGIPGSCTTSEYWSVDGADFFRYDTTNAAWMETLHKDGAAFSILAVFYPNGTSDGSVFGTNGGSGTGVGFRGRGGAAPNFYSLNAGVVALNTVATTSFSAGSWYIIGLSINENGGNVSFFYQNGSYNQVAASDTFDAAYTLPAAGSATYAMEVFARGNGSSPFDTGSRVAMFAAWQGGTQLTKANFDTLRAAIDAARPGYGF